MEVSECGLFQDAVESELRAHVPGPCVRRAPVELQALLADANVKHTNATLRTTTAGAFARWPILKKSK